MDGTELLTELINRFLGELINIILFYGGDVIKFAGDAIFVTWNISDPSQSANVRQTLLKAVQCAVDIQRTIKDYQMKDPDENVPIILKVRISIGEGELVGMHVGGVNVHSNHDDIFFFFGSVLFMNFSFSGKTRICDSWKGVKQCTVCRYIQFTW